MTSDEFAAARKRVGVTQEQWGEMLGISRFTVIDFERGTRRSDGQPAAIPKAHELACVALELGVRSYGDLAKHRADDRAYVRWAAKQLELPRRELEQQGRRLFPEVWNQYPYQPPPPRKMQLTEKTDAQQEHSCLLPFDKVFHGLIFMQQAPS